MADLSDRDRESLQRLQQAQQACLERVDALHKTYMLALNQLTELARVQQSVIEGLRQRVELLEARPLRRGFFG